MEIQKVDINIGDILDIERQPRKISKNYKLQVVKKTYKDRYNQKLNKVTVGKYEVIELDFCWVIINREVLKEFKNFTSDRIKLIIGYDDLVTALNSCYISDLDEARKCMKKYFDEARDNYNARLESERKTENNVEESQEWNGIKF